MPTTYIVFKGKPLFLRLLKVAFFARQKSQTAFISPFLSASGRRFRISLKPFSFWLLNGAAMETMPIWLARVSQKLLRHQKADFGQRLRQLLPKKPRKKFHQIKTFHLLLALELPNLFSAVSIEYFRFLIVQVSRFDDWKVLPPHLLLLSQPCIAYQRSAWLEEVKEAALSQITVESKLVSKLVEIRVEIMFSPWTRVLRKTQHYRMSCSYMLRTMRWLSGFAVPL